MKICERKTCRGPQMAAPSSRGRPRCSGPGSEIPICPKRRNRRTSSPPKLLQQLQRCNRGGGSANDLPSLLGRLRLHSLRAQAERKVRTGDERDVLASRMFPYCSRGSGGILDSIPEYGMRAAVYVWASTADQIPSCRFTTSRNSPTAKVGRSPTPSRTLSAVPRPRLNRLRENVGATNFDCLLV